MVVLACTRIGGFREDGGFDFTWHYFWLHVESSVAVFVVSLTAFRSLFVAEGPSANRRKARRWYSSNAVKKHLRPKPAIEDRDLEDCPTIPSASLSRVQMSARQGWLGLGSAENFSVPDRIMLQRREEELVNVIDDGYFGGLDNHSRTWNWV